MRLVIILLFSIVAKIGVSQSSDTFYSFKPCLFNKVCSVKSIRDTTIWGLKISFRIDNSDTTILYGELRNRKLGFYYSGPIKDQMLYIEMRDSKGEVIRKVSYKLIEVGPSYDVIGIAGFNARTEYKLNGLYKKFIREGYSRTYKNGKQVKSIYYLEGKPHKTSFF